MEIKIITWDNQEKVVSWQEHMQKVFDAAQTIITDARLRADLSETRRSMISVQNWLFEGYRRAQSREGKVAYTLPKDWRQKIDRLQKAILDITWEHLHKTDWSKAPPEGFSEKFWVEWHAGWEAEVAPRLKALAEEHGCTFDPKFPATA